MHGAKVIVVVFEIHLMYFVFVFQILLKKMYLYFAFWKVFVFVIEILSNVFDPKPVGQYTEVVLNLNEGWSMYTIAILLQIWKLINTIQGNLL